MSKTCEELYIKNVESGIRGIRIGGKKPSDVASSVATNFNRLKSVNLPMYEDLMEKYDEVVRVYNRSLK